jgi:hypothetical protein
LYPPCGTEIFKVFASRQSIDFEFIAQTKGKGVKGNFMAFEKLFAESYRFGIRGGSSNLSSTDGSIFDLLFRIKQAD